MPSAKSKTAQAAEPRSRDADRSQQAIVLAARDEFAQHGLGGARVDRIARAIADQTGQRMGQTRDHPQKPRLDRGPGFHRLRRGRDFLVRQLVAA